METLKIKIPKGFEVGSFDQKTGEITLKETTPKSVMDRIKCVDDVLTDNGFTHDEFYESCEGLTEDEVAYRILKLLTKSLNEGWIPDWSKGNYDKYYPWFEMRGSSGFRYDDYDRWYSFSSVGSRLCFKSKELAEYAGKQFTSVYKQFMVIE